MKSLVELEEIQRKRIHRGYLTIDYDEPDQSTYRSIELTNTETDELIKFDTGDFIIDFIMFKLYTQSSAKTTIYSIGCSSSYDHFFMDGENYKDQYIQFNEDGTSGVFISTEEILKLPQKEWDKNFEVYVINKTMKSYDDFINYWKEWKNNNIAFYEKWKVDVELF